MIQIRTLTAFLWLLVCIEGKTQSDTTFFSDTTITIDTSFLKDTSLNISSDTAFDKLTCATFEEDIMPIFETYCNSSGCHGNGQSASRWTSRDSNKKPFEKLLYVFRNVFACKIKLLQMNQVSRKIKT